MGFFNIVRHVTGTVVNQLWNDGFDQQCNLSRRNHLECFVLIFTGTGDRHWGRAHFIHNVQNWLFDRRQPVKVSNSSSTGQSRHGIFLSVTKWLNFWNCSVFQGPWRSSRVLLPGARSEMSCIQSHRPTLQDQAYLNEDCACFNWFR